MGEENNELPGIRIILPYRIILPDYGDYLHFEHDLSHDG